MAIPAKRSPPASSPKSIACTAKRSALCYRASIKFKAAAFCEQIGCNKKVSKQAFDKKLQEIESLRSDPASALAPLRKALKDRNNFLVSKAAAMAAYLRLEDLKPDLLAAFDRFLIQPVKTDPQCWPKTAIAKPLRDLDHQDAAVFLPALAHIQPDPAR